MVNVLGIARVHAQKSYWLVCQGDNGSESLRKLISEMSEMLWYSASDSSVMDANLGVCPVLEIELRGIATDFDLLGMLRRASPETRASRMLLALLMILQRGLRSYSQCFHDPLG